jgi:hypothetical protein
VDPNPSRGIRRPKIQRGLNTAIKAKKDFETQGILVEFLPNSKAENQRHGALTITYVISNGLQNLDVLFYSGIQELSTWQISILAEEINKDVFDW